MNKIWHEIDCLLFVVASITIANIHEFLSLIGLLISIIYTLWKIKKDFFNKDEN